MFVDTLLVLILLSVWVGLYQLVKQQGRMLLRLDSLEARLPAEHTGEGRETHGLAIGTAFPPFTLPDLSGKPVTLADFRGKQVLVVNWSPGCGFCEAIAADLARLQTNLPILLIAQGEAESNRELAKEHRLESPILPLNGTPPPAPFREMGTPVAYLLDAEGRVAQPVAIGADAVPALARAAVASPSSLPGKKSLTESSILRNGLKAGTPAPDFHLPDLQGRTVSLADYRGRKLLLAFSDPHCGPCDTVAPVLAKLHRKHANNGLEFLMVGRGSAEENRRKAKESEIAFPIVLQDKWKLSKQYGIFATPVAFLIGEDGIILKDVAAGVDAITALAQEGLGKGKDREHELSSR